MKLDGKICVVSGAAGGLGQEIALAMANAGGKVWALDIDEDGANKTAEAANGRALPIDLRDARDIGEKFAKIIEEEGRIDVLVNCAGLANRTLIEDITEDEWDLLCDVNLKGLFFASQAAYRVMMKNGFGRIINLSSIRGYRSDGRHVIYDSTKGAVHAMTRTFAVAGGKYNITCNSISPAYVLTPMTTHNLSTPGWQERITSHIPLGRLMQMREIADVACFLASEEASGVNGIDMAVDGGWTAGE